MTTFASVVLTKREGKIVFRAPRKEGVAELATAKRSAFLYWKNVIAQTEDKFHAVCLVCLGDRGTIRVHERGANASKARPWIEKTYANGDAKPPHIAQAAADLGYDSQAVPPPLPETLEINGALYRREI